MTLAALRKRVLICEDSKTYAGALRHALEYDGDIEVIGSVSSGEEALSSLQQAEPDVITMDIELPGMSGLEAVEQIMGTHPRPILIVSSHLGSSSQRTAEALAAGALDAMSKDALELLTPASASATALRARVRQLSHIPVIRHPRSRLRPREMFVQGNEAGSVIGICASTGGPQALRAVLSLLPGDFSIPVLVVQHIAAGFGEGLARRLDETISLDVRIADPGAAATAGVWLAPEGAHLVLGKGGVILHDRVTDGGLYRPSGDVLLRSLAAVAGNHAVAVVLSGMGRDAAVGAKAVRDAGGLVLAQDEASAAVYGMPKIAAQEAGATVLSLEEIGERLASLRPEPLR